MITIKLGCKGEAVKTLQTALNKYGYNLKVDGAFGTKTEAAVKDYQKKYGLSVDGIVGAKTWSKLGYSTSEVSMPRLINEIILHCSATKEGVNFTSDSGNAAHKARKFSTYVDPKTGAVKYIGYHFYIHLDGTIEACRPIGVRGCHAVNHNANSIGICYAGGLDKTDTNGTKIKDTRTPAQKDAILTLCKELIAEHPTIKRIIGHRDTSPDLNGNGVIEPFEFIKGCPCFDAIPEYKHLLKS